LVWYRSREERGDEYRLGLGWLKGGIWVLFTVTHQKLRLINKIAVFVVYCQDDKEGAVENV